MEIKSVDKDNLEEITSFLENLGIIKELNSNVVLNGEYVYDEEVIGFLSFEEFNKIGLIRYFVFKKVVDKKIINKLFYEITKKAKARKLEFLITLVVKEEAINIFKELGFELADSNDVFIEEVNIKDTRFKDAITLKYELN